MSHNNHNEDNIHNEDLNNEIDNLFHDQDREILQHLSHQKSPDDTNDASLEGTLDSGNVRSPLSGRQEQSIDVNIRQRDASPHSPFTASQNNTQPTNTHSASQQHLAPNPASTTPQGEVTHNDATPSIDPDTTFDNDNDLTTDTSNTLNNDYLDAHSPFSKASTPTGTDTPMGKFPLDPKGITPTGKKSGAADNGQPLPLPGKKGGQPHSPHSDNAKNVFNPDARDIDTRPDDSTHDGNLADEQDGNSSDAPLQENSDSEALRNNNEDKKKNDVLLPSKNPFTHPHRHGATNPVEKGASNLSSKPMRETGKAHDNPLDAGNDASAPVSIFGKPDKEKGREAGAGPIANPDDGITRNQLKNNGDDNSRNNDDSPNRGGAGGTLPSNAPVSSLAPSAGSISGMAQVAMIGAVSIATLLIMAMLISMGGLTSSSIIQADNDSDNDMCADYDNEASSDSYAGSKVGLSCEDDILPPKDGQKYKIDELVAIMRQAGFNDDDSIKAAAVAMSISGGSAGYRSGDHVGLMGINSKKKLEGDGANLMDNLENPWKNIQAAKIIQEKEGWDSFKDYNANKYENFMEGARAAAEEGLPDMHNDGSGCESDDSGQTFSGKLIYPMYDHSTVTSPFGPRGGVNHNGMDIAVPPGVSDEILAWADGKVKQAGPADGFGNWVVITSSINGKVVEHVYGHMTAASIKVKAGQRVKAGQIIAKQGSEGQSSGPHLHFEIHPNGWSYGGGVNPAPYLDKSTKLKKGQGASSAPSGGSAPTDNPSSRQSAGGGATINDKSKVMEGDGVFTASQINNIRIIIAVGQKMGFEKKAVLSALKISFNETRYTNYGNYGGRPWKGKQPTNGVQSPLGGSGSYIPGGSAYLAKSMDDPRRETDSDSDLNSVGIYQQQVQLTPSGDRAPEQAWATWEKAMDAGFAAQLFFDRLKKQSAGMNNGSDQGSWDRAASRVQGSVWGEAQASRSTEVNMGLVDKYWDAGKNIEVRLSNDLKADALSTDTSPTMYSEVGAECEASSLSSRGSNGGQLHVNSGTLSGRVVRLAADYANEAGEFSGITTYYSQPQRGKIYDPKPQYTDCSMFMSWAYWHGAGIWFAQANGHADVTWTLIDNMKAKPEVTLADPNESTGLKVEDLKPGDIFVNDVTRGSASGQHTWMYIGDGKAAESMGSNGIAQPDQVQVNQKVLRPETRPWLFRPLNAKHPQDLGQPIPDGYSLDSTIEALWKSNKKW